MCLNFHYNCTDFITISITLSSAFARGVPYEDIPYERSNNDQNSVVRIGFRTISEYRSTLSSLTKLLRHVLEYGR